MNMQIIDAHAHINGGDNGDEGAAFLKSLNMKAVTLAVPNTDGSWRDTNYNVYAKQAAKHPEQFAWITGFDPPDFREPNDKYVERVIAGLERDFADGAVACKVWKNIGMEVKKPDGSYLMIDDALFTPIFEWFERHGRPTVMHIGEPKACWLPLDPASPHYEYYRDHPQWHMHKHPEMPSHETIMAARDHVLERHPKMPLVGAHFGSMEYDMNEVAKRLDKYPNFAVDTSGRIGDAATSNDRETMRDFLIRYADRVLWGIDHGISLAVNRTEQQRQATREDQAERYRIEQAFYATDQSVTINKQQVKGLALPDAVQEKFFRENARAWYPGV